MKIIEIGTGRILYGKDSKEYEVTSKFWEALLSGKVKYRSGGSTGDINYTTINDLNLNQPDFEENFELIAITIIGEAVMTGKLPSDTML